MMKVLAIRGRIRRTGKKYVNIYIHQDYGGKELLKYVGKEVIGIIAVIDNESLQNNSSKVQDK